MTKLRSHAPFAALPSALVAFLALDPRLLDPRLSPYPCSFLVEQLSSSIIFEQLGRLLSVSSKPHPPDPPLVNPSRLAMGGSIARHPGPLVECSSPYRSTTLRSTQSSSLVLAFTLQHPQSPSFYLLTSPLALVFRPSTLDFSFHANPDPFPTRVHRSLCRGLCRSRASPVRGRDLRASLQQSRAVGL